MSRVISTKHVEDETIRLQPFGANLEPPNVVHKDRNIQPLKPLRNPLEVDPSPARVLQEVLHVLYLPSPVRLCALDLLEDGLEFLLVSSVQDEVEPFVVKLPSGGFAYAISGAGDDRIRRWTLEVLLPAIRGSEEVKPHEIEDGPQFCETPDETDVVDDPRHGECSEGEGCLVDILGFWWTLNTKYIRDPLNPLGRKVPVVNTFDGDMEIRLLG